MLEARLFSFLKNLSEAVLICQQAHQTYCRNCKGERVHLKTESCPSCGRAKIMEERRKADAERAKKDKEREEKAKKVRSILLFITSSQTEYVLKASLVECF